jgi:hypothetical protein
VHHYETQKWVGKWNITITKEETKMELCISASITRVGMKDRSVSKCLQLAQIAFRQCKHGCKKGKKNKRKEKVER